ncbi:WD domain-containing protein 4 [Elsinoe fawcettii]|nr:WD domain-containing protein 4 [Elsinoe fawcettii]
MASDPALSVSSQPGAPVVLSLDEPNLQSHNDDLQNLPSPGTDMSENDSEETLCHHDHEHESLKSRRQQGQEDDTAERNITIPTTSKHAEHAVAPFLAKHIPSQYNPVGHARPSKQEEDQPTASSSTKFCYRHRPDLKCRRQANEPSMDQLQNELGRLSQSDQQAISHVWSLFSAAPSKHRNLMLQGVLTQCCFPQLSFISASVRDLIKIDFLSALPSELGFKILCYLDTTSLCKAAQVSRRWRSLADDDVVWHRMCEQHIDRKCTKCGWGLPLLERKRLRIEKRQIQLRATGQGLNQISPPITPFIEQTAEDTNVAAGVKRPAEDTDEQSSPKKTCTDGPGGDESYFRPRVRPWKDVYKDRFKVGTNWKYGRCTTRTFKGHTNGVMCLQFDDSILATGSYDATIKIWDIATGKCLRTLTGHTSGIRCLQFDDSKLMSGSLDNTIKVWNWRTGQLLRTFNAHNGGVIALHFDTHFLVSGSMDHTIRVYDLRSSTKCTFLLRGHTDWVNAVKIDSASRTLVSASDDCTVRLWDLDTKQCIKVFEGHVGQVQQCLFLPHEFDLDDADLASGDKDDDASSTSSRTPPATNIHPHPHHVQHHVSVSANSSFDATAQPFWPSEADKDRPAPPRYMLTGALDSTIRLWDVHAPATYCSREDRDKPPASTSCLRTFFGHVEGIWSLAADHLRLVSGSEDRMVKIWDPRTGKCERTWTGHAGPVTCVGLSDSRLVSGSEDCEVRMLVFGEERCREDGDA